MKMKKALNRQTNQALNREQASRPMTGQRHTHNSEIQR